MARAGGAVSEPGLCGFTASAPCRWHESMSVMLKRVSQRFGSFIMYASLQVRPGFDRAHQVIIHPVTLAHRPTVSLGWPSFSIFVRFGQFVVNRNCCFCVSMRSLYSLRLNVCCSAIRIFTIWTRQLTEPPASFSSCHRGFVCNPSRPTQKPSNYFCTQNAPQIPATTRKLPHLPATVFRPPTFVKKPVLPSAME